MDAATTSVARFTVLGSSKITYSLNGRIKCNLNSDRNMQMIFVNQRVANADFIDIEVAELQINKVTTQHGNQDMGKNGDQVREWFFGHPHAFYYHHLKHNIEARFAGSNNKETRETVIQLFTSCAYTLLKKRFHKKLNELKKEGGDVIKSFLSGLPFKN
ncbi:hypothetical protein LguiB_021796 [Lonicera macranthoides]